MTIKSRIRTIPHYPKQGVMFRDITTLLKDPLGFRLTINEMVKRYAPAKIDKVAGIESRGFIIGAASRCMSTRSRRANACCSSTT
jgi:adenine phosphoribosyltransferase